jgi:hypothetical protein
MHKTMWFWAVAMACAGITNALALWIFTRLAAVGYPRRWWRMEDFKLYKLYWKLAPEHGWSRMPLLASGVSLLIAGAALFLALFAS